ncbi:MAG TPA: hypothetical protein VFW05_10955 [Verrucomicrobiae bacterium]|nr:hypothetical protein [Verrucomicrobiae bacterium]
MKTIVLAFSLIAIAGCSTPNPHPSATHAAYHQVTTGMTRAQVYALLGPPRSMHPGGDFDHCESATWGIPHNSHGWGRWTIHFDGDTVRKISTSHATTTFSASH